MKIMEAIRKKFEYIKKIFIKDLKLKDLGEFELIENIKLWVNSKNEDNKSEIVGIGDDAAVINNFFGLNSENILLSVDTLVEGTHFTRDITNFFELGWKSLAVNVSDIASMGGIPKYAMISFACPKYLKVEDLKKFYFGFKELADLSGVKLVGGDTVKTNEKIVVSVSIIGETINKNYALRKGAETGNFVFATGTFGDSALGLKQLLKNKNIKSYFTDRFNSPMPRFKEGEFLGKNNFATAMMDVSDGLAFSLNDMADKSKKGFLIYEGKVPFSEAMQNVEKKLNYALYGGEDYELVFCAKKENLDKILAFGNISLIGEVFDNFDGVKMLTKNNKIISIPKKGYVAF
jgi:thiamine-monophosphate kinase